MCMMRGMVGARHGWRARASDEEVTKAIAAHPVPAAE